MLNQELPKTYNPADYEDKIYQKWEQSGYFNPDNLPCEIPTESRGVKRISQGEAGEPYSIMMPPPNVTGVLHLGHALENSLMDIMARYQRMNGKKVLLLPGTDHAAIATQAKVEKILVEQGIKNPRQKLGREKLLAEIRGYAENSKAIILKQIRKMGTSCDWSRLAYTFDEARGRAVNEMFIKMYHGGLIYRGNRVVNWSVKGQSTCSDDELVYMERPAKLYTFKYNTDFPIPIATTRPETKLGDTAVAVNPQDKKYKKYIGQTFTVDIGAAKPLAIIIISDENVDSNFGTGAVGVTPAHSMIDFAMYEKQKIKGEPIGLIQVIDQNGRMTANAGNNYKGLATIEAREKFVNWLNKNGLLEKEEEIRQNVGTSDRFGDAVEVLPMTQWFIDVNKKISGKDKSLKDLMRQAVTVGHNNDPEQKVKITPQRFEKIYLNWIDNLRDWCISRQIWWGHRVPVWYCGGVEKEEQKKMGFHSSIVPELLNGKRRTYRIHDHNLVVGDRVAIEDSGSRILLGYATITGVQKLTIGEIPLPDMIHSGKYKTTPELIQAFKRMHPEKDNITEDTPAIIYDYDFSPFMKEDQKNGCGQVIANVDEPKNCPACRGTNLIQDQDTLDTWFSSGLWTFSTLGWPGGKMEIIASRHCTTDLHKDIGRFIGQEKETDFDLNEEGKKQAEKLARDLKKEKIDIIFTSRLKRVQQTALIVNKYHNVQIIEDERLLEYRFGFMNGKNREELLKKYPDLPEWKNWGADYRYKDEEKPVEVMKRAQSFLVDLKNNYPDKKIYLVTSSGVLDFIDLLINKKSFEEIKNTSHKKGGIEHYKLELDKDLKTFHPTSWMQMGYEILFFWLARMILMSTYALDQIPFQDVYIHGMLRNEASKKFSKSSGNNIDPLGVMAKYGTDALRLSLISGIAPGNDSRFYEEKVEGARNMVNKLWNVARYIITNFQFSIFNFQLNADKLTMADRWILGKLNNLIKEVAEDLDSFKFSEAVERLRVFTWDNLADWYLEVSKFEKTYKKKELLQYILENILKLWHPFMPFVTEAIWQQMGHKNLLMVEKWPVNTSPQPSPYKGEGVGDFELVKDIIIAIRNVRSQNKIEPAKKIKAVIYAGKNKELIESQAPLIKSLRTGISELEIKTKGEKIPQAIYAAVGKIEIYLVGAVDSEKEKARLEKEIGNLEKIIKAAAGKLSNKEFTSQAPANIVAKEKEKLEGWQAELKKLRKQLESFK